MSCCMSFVTGTLQGLLSLCSFLNMCNQYGLLSKDAKAAACLDGQRPLDQNTRRLQKVRRFKREREIKAKLSSTQMRQMRIAQLQDEVLCILKPYIIILLTSFLDCAPAAQGFYMLVSVSQCIGMHR